MCLGSVGICLNLPAMCSDLSVCYVGIGRKYVRIGRLGVWNCAGICLRCVSIRRLRLLESVELCQLLVRICPFRLSEFVKNVFRSVCLVLGIVSESVCYVPGSVGIGWNLWAMCPGLCVWPFGICRTRVRICRLGLSEFVNDVSGTEGLVFELCPNLSTMCLDPTASSVGIFLNLSVTCPGLSAWSLGIVCGSVGLGCLNSVGKTVLSVRICRLGLWTLSESVGFLSGHAGLVCWNLSAMLD